MSARIHVLLCAIANQFGIPQGMGGLCPSGTKSRRSVGDTALRLRTPSPFLIHYLSSFFSVAVNQLPVLQCLVLKSRPASIFSFLYLRTNRIKHRPENGTVNEMRASAITAAVSAVVALAAPAALVAERATTPTVYLAGDSTMAQGGGGTGTQGMLRSRVYSTPDQ